MKSTLKKILKIIGKILSFVVITVFIVLINIILIINMFCNGPSKKARSLFATTLLETGNFKFIVSYFLSDEEINSIVSSNSLKDFDEKINTDLIEVTNNNNNLIVVEDISGKTFSGKMMIISDPSKVCIATTYPWREYGKELDKLVNENKAIAGINGGLYVSAANKGGKPIGIAVSNGEVQLVNTGYKGIYLIGFDNENKLRIISLEGMNAEQIKKVVADEHIRDAIAFQEEATDKNNHFVKLIINGQARELNGLGSGANPRTAIGQKADGTVLMLVTDGRGANGHLGATASDLIEIMQKYGAVNAANLDGGSSSCMYYKGNYLMDSVTLYYTNSSWKLPTAFIVKDGESL